MHDDHLLLVTSRVLVGLRVSDVACQLPGWVQYYTHLLSWGWTKHHLREYWARKWVMWPEFCIREIDWIILWTLSSTECDTSSTQLCIFKWVILVSLGVQLYQIQVYQEMLWWKVQLSFGWVDKRTGDKARMSGLEARRETILVSLGGQEYPGRN